ncbi:hypothetical protein [Streptomyces sp. NPDC057910]
MYTHTGMVLAVHVTTRQSPPSMPGEMAGHPGAGPRLPRPGPA